ncbi:MAG TPA: alpha/beta fold hydrolase [Phenylobacterium sp.]|jgi:pimeloyl-ACP methyl ester carboxylesterase|uniref:alpha/beta fold hydrolase n=1 Tax=Phenylobacterium sp. TaxID=1871053 RepID=UPI002CFF2BAA|nr:alpha/beta fold hydrolase [Phenylobacterium sp.]HXA39623.1 alpha/beta fold hydrolase [Phenylobacterium sp.]
MSALSRRSALTLAVAAALAPAMAQAQAVRTFSRTDAKGKVTIAATVRGKGPLVVLVPSLGRGASDFDDLAARLAAAGYQVAAVDPRGLGQSRGPMTGVTMFDLADDFGMVARGLSDKPAVFIGHAHGNRIVRALASRRPEQVSRLILLAAGGQVKMEPEVQTALQNVFVETLSAEQHLAAVKTAFFAPGNDPSVWRGGWYPDVAAGQTAAGAATPNGEWLDGGHAPILIVQAANDRVAAPTNAEALKQAHPDRVTVVTIPNAGHAMLPEQPKLIADIVIGYLKTAPPV